MPVMKLKSFPGLALLMIALVAGGGSLLLGPTRALAGDLIFSPSSSTVLTEASAGQPYWRLHAQCAGMLHAAFNYNSQNDRTQQAVADRDASKTMLLAAIDRLQQDRGMDRKAALNLALVQMNIGSEAALPLLHSGGTGPKSPWNIQRSICMDILDAYRGT
jgi:hypothetical protein